MRTVRLIALGAILLFLVVMTLTNWHDVMIDIWGGQRMAIKLPLLLSLTFALGFLPTWLVDRWRIGRLKKRLSQYESVDTHRPPQPPEPRRASPPEPTSPF